MRRQQIIITNQIVSALGNRKGRTLQKVMYQLSCPMKKLRGNGKAMLVSVMGQRRINANTKDVPALHRKEEYVLGTEPKLRHVVTKDVPIMPRKEEFVERMGQSLQQPILRLAIMKDVPIKQRKEEYVSDMVPELRGRDAVTKDVPVMLSWEEYV